MILVEAISGDVNPAFDNGSSTLKITEPTNQHATCQICFDEFNRALILTTICKASCPAIVCNSCASDYIRIHTESTPSGVLSRLKCPICITPVNLMRLKTRFPTLSSLVCTFESRVQATCDVLCPKCHVISNFLPCTKETTNPIKLSPSIASKLPQLRRLGELYCRHKVSLQELWTFLTTEFPDHYLELVNRMLPLIHDTERRAGLFLRIMRISPFVYSTCCNAALCFNCKTSEHHDGLSCSAMLKDTEDIAVCPDCNLTLVKGDGCNWVTCFCGYSFEWRFALFNFKVSQIPPKALDRLKAGFKIYVIKTRFRVTVLLSLVRQVNIQLYKSTFQAVSSYLRRKRWMSRFKVSVLPSAMAKVILMDIEKQSKPMLAVCEYLRHLTWRKKFKEFLSPEIFRSTIEKHRIQRILSSRKDIYLAMKHFAVKIRRSIVFIRMNITLNELMRTNGWRSINLNMTDEERNYNDEEMTSIFALDNIF